MLFGIPLGELALLAVALTLAGLLTGVLAGLFGIGGGAIAVPILYELFRLLQVPEAVRMHLCVGTALAIIIPTSIRSFHGHLKRGSVRKDVLRLWALPVLAGVGVGSFIAVWSPGALLKLLFALCTGFNGLKLLLNRTDWKLGEDFPPPAGMRGYGFGIGTLSAIIGVGGGMFSNLIFSVYNRPIHQAVSTSAGLGILIAIPGTLGYIIGGWSENALLPPGSLGYVSLIGFILVAPSSVLATSTGVRLAHRFSKRQLEFAFGLFQILIAARFTVDLAQRYL